MSNNSTVVENKNSLNDTHGQEYTFKNKKVWVFLDSQPVQVEIPETVIELTLTQTIDSQSKHISIKTTSESSEINPPPSNTPEKCVKKVFLVGTAHVSPKSAAEAVATIQAIKPAVVGLELCSSRINMLTEPEGKSFQAEGNENEKKEEESLIQCIMKAIKKNQETNKRIQDESNKKEQQQTSSDPKSDSTPPNPSKSEPSPTDILKNSGTSTQSAVFAALVHYLYSHLLKHLQVVPGMEFRSAFQEGLRIGSKIALIDRPVQATLNRTTSALTTWEKLQLLYIFLTSDWKISMDDIEYLKDKDIITALLEEVSHTAPSLLEPLLYERDRFMISRLFHTAISLGHESSSIVAVVGLGHVDGMRKEWEKNPQQISIAELLRTPPSAPFYKSFLFQLFFFGVVPVLVFFSSLIYYFLF